MSKARLFLTLKTFLSKKIKRAHSLMSVLIPFRHTPFPLKSSANNFFDIIQDGKRGHTSARGGIYWEEQTYSDNRVLISIPPHFNPEQSPLIVVYLHGNQSSLARDVINRQHIPQQLADSKLNAILVAPQFAVNALDSSSGNFATQDFFAHFINELIEQICKWRTYASHKTTLENAKIIIVAYSGGYLPAAHILNVGGVTKKIAGVILLDALYSEEETFAKFLVQHHTQSFFFSCFSDGASQSNINLKKNLAKKNIEFEEKLPKKLIAGRLSFLKLNKKIAHNDLLSIAWKRKPLKDLLKRIA